MSNFSSNVSNLPAEILNNSMLTAAEQSTPKQTLALQSYNLNKFKTNEFAIPTLPNNCLKKNKMESTLNVEYNYNIPQEKNINSSIPLITNDFYAYVRNIMLNQCQNVQTWSNLTPKLQNHSKESLLLLQGHMALLAKQQAADLSTSTTVNLVNKNAVNNNLNMILHQYQQQQQQQQQEQIQLQQKLQQQFQDQREQEISLLKKLNLFKFEPNTSTSSTLNSTVNNSNSFNWKSYGSYYDSKSKKSPEKQLLSTNRKNNNKDPNIIEIIDICSSAENSIRKRKIEESLSLVNKNEKKKIKITEQQNPQLENNNYMLLHNYSENGHTSSSQLNSVINLKQESSLNIPAYLITKMPNKTVKYSYETSNDIDSKHSMYLNKKNSELYEIENEEDPVDVTGDSMYGSAVRLQRKACIDFYK